MISLKLLGVMSDAGLRSEANLPGVENDRPEPDTASFSKSNAGSCREEVVTGGDGAQVNSQASRRLPSTVG